DRLARGRLLRLHHGGARPRLRHPRAQCRLPRRRLHDLPGRRRPRYRTHPAFPRRGDHRLHLAPARLRLRNLLTHPSTHPSEPPPLQPPTPPTTHPSEPPPVGSPPGSGPHSVRVPASGGSRSFGSPLRVVPPFRVPAPGVPASRGPRPFGSPSLRAPALLGSLSRLSLSRPRPVLFWSYTSVVSLYGAENSRAFPVRCFGAGVTVVEPLAEPPNPALPATVVLPDDPRYPSLLRGMNHRFTPRPVYVQVVTTTEQVVAAVTEAVRSGRRVTARSGGHCFEDFT